MSTKNAKDIQFFVNDKAGVVSGLLNRPSTAMALLVLAHGAGAGMRHRFMEELAARLAGATSQPCVTSFLIWKSAPSGRIR